MSYILLCYVFVCRFFHRNNGGADAAACVSFKRATFHVINLLFFSFFVKSYMIFEGNTPVNIGKGIGIWIKSSNSRETTAVFTQRPRVSAMLKSCQ